ncbi:MAG TPA: hypothetical protein VHN11_10730, partial [Xanthobacteraceae bacterium]|nr:hypothetical protein [Xanthobacteraceae bacterium]
MASAMTPVRKHAAHHTARGVDIDPDTGAIVDPNTGETFIDNKALLDSGATVTQNIVVLAATTTITGSNGDDSLPGTAGDDLILGLDGN